MNIDKIELQKKFKVGDLEYVFAKAEEISKYLILSKFKISNQDLADDMSQECLENFWKKITQEKVKKDKNLFAFIWQNSTFRILEMLRKERNRKTKAEMLSYDSISEADPNYVDWTTGSCDKYTSTVIKELSTVTN